MDNTGTAAADLCTVCVAVEGSDGAVTCTSASDTRVAGCGAAYDHTDNTASPGVADVCTCLAGTYDSGATCSDCTVVGNRAGAVTCTDATDTRAAGCATGFYHVVGGGVNATTMDQCVSCVPVTNSTGAATCTTASDSRVSACASGYFYTDNSASSTVADTCTACTPLPYGFADGATFTCTGAADTRVSACAEGTRKIDAASAAVADQCVYCDLMYSVESVVRASCTACSGDTTADCTAATCKAGFYGYSAGTCTACPATNAATDANITCTSAADVQITHCVDGYFLAAGTADSCTLCAPIADSTGAVTCTSASDSRVSVCAASKALVPGGVGAADTCVASLTTCAAVENSDETPTCTSQTDSRVGACNAGYFKVAGAAGAADECLECTSVLNAAAGATYTCTSASDSRVSECASDPAHWNQVGGEGEHDACVVVGSCEANAYAKTPATATSDVICGCLPASGLAGFWAVDGGVASACAAWTPCGAGMSISIDGTESKDQVCGLKVVASLAVPGAVADINQFMSAIQSATATGGADVVVEIKSFEQKVESTASVPGTASDFSSDAAQVQFKAGVLAAVGGVGTVGTLCIDGQSCTAGSCSACAGRRRLSDDSRRRLQSSVNIAYDVTVDDPTVAAAMVVATRDTSAFAATLVSAINDAAPLTGGIAPIDARLVSVAEPVMTTVIAYEVTVITADPADLAAVSSTLSSASSLTSALSAAVDTGGVALAIDASELTAVVVCGRPADAGYTYTETNLDPSAFAVTAVCADGYESAGAQTVTTCPSGGTPFVLGGQTCTPIVCTTPAVMGYTVTSEGNVDLSAGLFDVAWACDPTPSSSVPGGYGGTAVAAACTSSGAYTLTGCTAQAVVCDTRASGSGYTIDETSLTPGADADGDDIGDTWDVSATCDTASGYEGTAVVTECAMTGPYTVTGCKLPPPLEDDSSGAGVIVGIVVAVVAIGVIAFFGIKSMKAKGASETTGARPSMLSPSAAAYQTDDVDPEDTSQRPGRKLSF